MLRAVVASDSETVWIAGDQGIWARTSTNGWTKQSPTGSFEAIALGTSIGTTEAWAVGANAAWRWTGATWLQEATPTANLTAVVMTPNQVIVAGDSRAWRYSNGLFMDVSPGLQGTMVNQLFAVGTIYACGSDTGGGALYAFNGSFWDRAALPGTLAKNVLTGMWGAGADLYLVATTVGVESTILRLEATTMVTSTVYSSNASPLDAIHGTSANDLWAVGTGGVVVHGEGTTWSPVPGIPNSVVLRDVFATTNRIWAVGDNGAVYHFDR